MIQSIKRLRFCISELKCGGILHEKNGQFSTPNFPDTYPVGLTCLWIIRVPDSKGIKVDFNNPVDVGKQPQCLDYVLTFENGKYPSQAEPLIECGSKIAKKSFESNEVWIEFRSTGSGSGTGFRATYEAWFNIPTTSRPVSKYLLIHSILIHFMIMDHPQSPIVNKNYQERL